MTIVLIGMRGSGKTSVANKLSKKLSLPIFDTDRLIEDKTKMSVSNYVRKFGWDAFRERESEIVEELVPVSNAVISTGGGIILQSKNIENLRIKGTFIFLKTSVDTMIKRIKHAKNRPPLTDKKTLRTELEEVWNERKEQYEKIADIMVVTDNKTAEEVTTEIITQL